MHRLYTRIPVLTLTPDQVWMFDEAILGGQEPEPISEIDRPIDLSHPAELRRQITRMNFNLPSVSEVLDSLEPLHDID